MREKRFYMIRGDVSSIRSIMTRFNPEAYAVGVGDNGRGFLDVYTDTSEFIELHEVCARNNVRLIHDRFEMEYTKAELENAKYLNIRLDSYCSSFPKEYGTIYSYDCKCKCCGSGKEQVSELIIDKTKMGKKDISKTYDHDVIVSQKLHDIFLENNITGASFREVRHRSKKMKDEPVLYQLLATSNLPPMNNKSVFYKEKFCECCQKSGLFLQTLPHYTEEALKEAKDINYTYEYFGGGWAGSPYIIVSQKVYRLIRDNKIKNIVFDIVEIV